MLYVSLAMLVISALCHATWNIVSRGAKDKLTFLWLQMVCSILFLSIPVFFFLPLPTVEALPTLLLSGLMQGAYYLLLAKTYTIGDIGVVYPLTRGSAPVFVCLFSTLLGLETITLPMFLSVLLIFIGIYIVNMERLDKQHLLAPFKAILTNPPVRLSLLNGIIIAIYSLSDSVSVTYCHPLTVYYIIAVIPAVMLLPYMLKKGLIKQEIKACNWKIAVVSILTFIAYALVLFAMQLSSAGYASAVREMSIVFVAVYTAITSKNNHRTPIVIGAVCIFIGVFLLSFFRS